MKSENAALRQIVLAFAKKYEQEFEAIHKHKPVTTLGDDWPSPCHLGDYDEEHKFWQVVPMVQSLDFSNVEKALNIDFHQDIKTYFLTLFADDVHASCSEGELSLLFAWSEHDFERLQQNIIGHLLMKQKLKQQATIFFAVTDQEDIILSLLNDTGEIWVERVGSEPHKKIANSMSEFFAMLTPSIDPVPEE